jgi:hypothetical protein
MERTSSYTVLTDLSKILTISNACNALQGFLKIAEVDAQGKPQKLRLKNEIRKAMSLPGNSALMVCNVPQVGTPTLPLSADDNTPLRDRGIKTAAHKIEKEAKATCNTIPTKAQQSPIAYSDVSNLYSFGNNPSEAPLLSDVSPAAAAVTSISSPNPVCVDLKLKTYARGSSSKLSTNPTLSSKPPSAKSNRTLRFAGVDSVTPTGKETSGNATAVSPGEVVVAIVCEDPGPVLKPCTERIVEKKVSPTSSIETVIHSDVESREPLRNVQNTCVNDIVAPVKKRPWKRTQCDNPNVAVAVQEPLSTSSGMAFILVANRNFLVREVAMLPFHFVRPWNLSGYSAFMCILLEINFFMMNRLEFIPTSDFFFYMFSVLVSTQNLALKKKTKSQLRRKS